MSSSLLTPFSTSVSVDQVNATALPLPTGAATQTTLAALLAVIGGGQEALSVGDAFDAWLAREDGMPWLTF